MRYKLWLIAILCLPAMVARSQQKNSKRPNLLFVITDDQSFPYASAYGTPGVRTPVFDAIAASGVLFNNAFAAAPQCSPSRAAILTGRNIWQLEEAGTHSSYFPNKFPVFTTLLRNAGYATGYTGKAWGPGNWEDAGWKENPVGPAYNKQTLKPPYKAISNIDYSTNFQTFYQQKQADQPFFFWVGAHEPHRPYANDSGGDSGGVYVPGFLPDHPVVQNDIRDYMVEIAWFDAQLGKILDFLRERGELENTLIVLTSDNGMPFPSAKATLMEYGAHVPLAISWKGVIGGGRKENRPVGLIDLASTFLEAAGLAAIPHTPGKSLLPLLKGKTDPSRNAYVLTGMERHSASRPDNVGYPARAIRTADYLFVLNFKPGRWPAGDPPPVSEPPSPSPDIKPIGPGYSDVDDPSPSKMFLISHRDEWPLLFRQGFEKRPAEQLFDIRTDPGCTKDLSTNPAFDSVRNVLRGQLKDMLTQQGDPRMHGNGDIFESYPRFGNMRNWPGFKKRGEYNPAFQHH
ncbi:sulfatase [Chitinophaga sp. GCM10012297]|uniref:Sulfatase n=1 Tax=Chitinophaga chungangae TaxID=2821488 RepID=A0ABS3YGA2_9BACT|nr:sulfatase [Chitinophaga chungangae]MBO9153475.1 sulfatase [Chitinophaga chungangae]